MSKTPKPPFSLSSEAQTLWAQVYSTFSKDGDLRDVELIPLCRYCEHLAEWYMLQQRCAGKESTSLLETAKGNYYHAKDPNFTRLEKVCQELRALEKQFGLAKRPSKNTSKPSDDLDAQRSRLYRAK